MRNFPTSSRVADVGSAVPLTLVLGENGAGKTTLLTHLLTAAKDGRVAAINGDEDVVSSLAQLNPRAGKIDHLFLEVSSSTPIRRAMGYTYMPGYRPAGSLLVLNADTVVRMQLEELPAALEHASMVIVNKIDAHPAAAVTAGLAWLDRYLTPMPVLATSYGKVAAPLLLGVDPNLAGVPLVNAPWSPDLEITAEARRGRRNRGARLGDRCRGWTLQSSLPVDTIEFRRWVEKLPSDVVRGQGVVYTRSEPNTCYRFELFGSHWGLQREGLWGDRERCTNITLISPVASLKDAARDIVATAAPDEAETEALAS
jgi:G3E family GTPase